MIVFARSEKTRISSTLSNHILSIKQNWKLISEITNVTSITQKSIPSTKLNPRKECHHRNQTNSVEDAAKQSMSHSFLKKPVNSRWTFLGYTNLKKHKNLANLSIQFIAVSGKKSVCFQNELTIWKSLPLLKWFNKASLWKSMTLHHQKAARRRKHNKRRNLEECINIWRYVRNSRWRH